MPKNYLTVLKGILGIAMVVSCGGTTGGGADDTDGGTGNDDGGQQAGELAFPYDLKVASPFSSDTAAQRRAGTSGEKCGDFDPAEFLVTASNANCYGPEIDYQHHPDTPKKVPPNAPGKDGTLPTGDLGLWSETDSETGEACAAAQLNSRMQSTESRTSAALDAAEALVCLAEKSGMTLDNNTVDLIDSVEDTDTVAYTLATVSHSDKIGGDTFTYDLEFTYSPDADNSYDVVLRLYHIPGCDGVSYQGNLHFAYNSTAMFGNCGGGSDVTIAGSLTYSKESESSMAVDAREAQFCEHDADTFTGDGNVDPELDWADTFSIFAANFDPTNGDEGTYSYAWQAGHGDQYTRVFNVQIEDGGAAGDAFFGYGNDIIVPKNFDGSIAGFICNWYGPGNNHVKYFQSDKVQYQRVEESGGTFGATTSRILYAPTNSCDVEVGDDFTYDTDGNGKLDDVSAGITNDLADISKIDFSPPEQLSAPTGKDCGGEESESESESEAESEAEAEAESESEAEAEAEAEAESEAESESEGETM